MTLQSNRKPKINKAEHSGQKRKKLGKFLKDAAIATVIIPVTLVAVASTLAFLMALIW